jgi:kynurenine formamidase
LRSAPGAGTAASTEIVIGGTHASTHVDALCHFAFDGRIFGGASVSDSHTDVGWREHGIETVPPIIGRGILLDVPALLEVDRLEDRFEVTADHLRGCLRSQGTDLRNGDVVLVRTGKIADFSADPERYVATQPGVGATAAIWAFQRGMAVLGTDTASTEPRPIPEPPWTTHAAMLVERGVHLVETLNLDGLAAAGCYEFAFICLPLAISGATASWVRPIALR